MRRICETCPAPINPGSRARFCPKCKALRALAHSRSRYAARKQEASARRYEHSFAALPNAEHKVCLDRWQQRQWQNAESGWSERVGGGLIRFVGA